MESSKFVSDRPRMSGGFAPRKDLHLPEFERRARVLVKFSFREMSDSR